MASSMTPTTERSATKNNDPLVMLRRVDVPEPGKSIGHSRRSIPLFHSPKVRKSLGNRTNISPASPMLETPSERGTRAGLDLDLRTPLLVIH